MTNASKRPRFVAALTSDAISERAEISALTGWSISLVKVRAFRARRKMRDHALKLQKEAKL